ncbi:MAG: flavodoxin family protein [Candidatus Bathyarchaeia archaeon]|jgi:multimeric flavodoxin WrbA
MGFEAGNVRIVGLSGSPRVDGNTDLVLKEALAAAKAEGADVNLIRVSDYRLLPCNGCMTCFSTKKCVNEDDGENLYQELTKADGVIMGSPSYFQGVTAQMKIFIDRIGFLALARGRKDFAEKVGGVIAVARRSGVSSTCNQMITFMTAVGMIIPSGGRVFAIGREKGEVAKDQEGIDTARHLGKMMVRTLLSSIT